MTPSQKEHHVLGPTGRTDDRRNESFQGVKIDIPTFNICSTSKIANTPFKEANFRKSKSDQSRYIQNGVDFYKDFSREKNGDSIILSDQKGNDDSDRVVSFSTTNLLRSLKNSKRACNVFGGYPLCTHMKHL